MKKLGLITLVMVFLFGFASAYAGDENPMVPPKPIDNKMLDSMVGNWKGQTEMMGMKMDDTLDVSWQVNHQFLVMKLIAQGVKDPNVRYEGVCVIGLDQNNQAKTWWFDSWGAAAVATGSGRIDQNKIILKDGNADFKEERSFVVSGDTMTMTAKGTMKMNGKTTPYVQTGTYKRVG